jgi:thymidine kinase
MAKLHFFYSSMNAGKSTSLLQSNHNFEENNLSTILFLPQTSKHNHEIDIVSRIGIQRRAVLADKNFNFLYFVKKNNSKKLKCIFVDEAQFLKKVQVNQLGNIADDLDITVMCYGLRTDFKGKLFEGSARLLSIADNLHELKTICTYCTRKATMTIRLDENGKVDLKGRTIKTNSNQLYKPVCRNHFKIMTQLF